MTQTILCRLTLLVMAITFLSLPIRGAEVKGNDDANEKQRLEVLREKIQSQLAEEETRQMRVRLQQRIVELAGQRREDAKTEVQRATEEKNRLLQIVNAKEWAIRSFDETENQFLPILSDSPTFMKNWLRAQAINREKFLKFPELSRNEIKTGKALNFFLDACGPTAVEHNIFIDQMKAKVAAGGEIDPQLLRQLEIVEQLGNDPLIRFNADRLRSVRVALGLTGAKLPIRLNDEPLPLDWPPALRHALNDKYRPFLTNIELTKKRCLRELHDAPPNARNGMGIPPALQVELMQAVDLLCAVFNADTEKMIEVMRRPGEVVGPALMPEDRVQRVVAVRYLRELRNGVTRFIEARRSDDVQVANFPPENETVGVRELLTFMSRHNLRFAEADINDENTYKDLYKSLVDYYTELYRLKFTSEATYRQIELAEKDINRAKDIQFERIDVPEVVTPNEVLVEASRAAAAFFDSLPRRVIVENAPSSPTVTVETKVKVDP